jgi:hypothetical protein
VASCVCLSLIVASCGVELCVVRGGAPLRRMRWRPDSFLSLRRKHVSRCAKVHRKIDSRSLARRALYSVNLDNAALLDEVRVAAGREQRSLMLAETVAAVR